MIKYVFKLTLSVVVVMIAMMGLQFGMELVNIPNTLVVGFGIILDLVIILFAGWCFWVIWKPNLKGDI